MLIIKIMCNFILNKTWNKNRVYLFLDKNKGIFLKELGKF